MKEFLRKNFAIMLAFILPISLIVIIALSVYLPSRLLSTDYNFVYSTCTEGPNYYSFQCASFLQSRYSVVDNRLVVNPIDPTQDLDKNGILDINENYTVRIFLHDTKKNESREITIEEAQALKLSGLLTSPDGVTVSANYSSGPEFLFFGSGSSYGYYLTKGNVSKSLNLINSNNQNYYQDNFKFVGWVLPGNN